MEFNIKEALNKLNIKKLNPLQEESIKAYNEGNNIYLLSPTGSGKTLAFLLPLISKLRSGHEGIQALVLCPSRELALQIESVFKKLQTGFKVNCCYGGHSMKIEKNNLLHPPTLLIGTPGRIADHIRNERISCSSIHSVVLDEFDKSLEFGFLKDMEYIIREARYAQQKMLISATDIDELPEFISNVEFQKIDRISNHIQTKAEIKIVDPVGEEEKVDSLIRLLSNFSHEKNIVFFNHQDAVNRISSILKEQNVPHTVFHGGLKQEHRERELIKLRNGSTNILLATDLAARGIDIPEIQHIIHYQIPHKEDAFIHRNGRTARMSAEGNVYILKDLRQDLPDYVDSSYETIVAPKQSQKFFKPKWITLYLDLGRKNKVSKMDIVGLFCKKGGLGKGDLGLIEVLDYSSYIAINKHKHSLLTQKIKNERIKNKKLKLSLSK